MRNEFANVTNKKLFYTFYTCVFSDIRAKVHKYNKRKFFFVMHPMKYLIQFYINSTAKP